jgi:hypothetical protein
MTDDAIDEPLEKLAEHLSARGVAVSVESLDYSLNRCGLVVIPEHRLTLARSVDVEKLRTIFEAWEREETEAINVIEAVERLFSARKD